MSVQRRSNTYVRTYVQRDLRMCVKRPANAGKGGDSREALKSQ